MPRPLSPHGTHARYHYEYKKTGTSCRCEPCIAAVSVYMKEMRTRLHSAGAVTTDAPHGTNTRYLAELGISGRTCDCQPCKDAHAAKANEYGKTDAGKATARRTRVKQQYGLDGEALDAMLAEQNNLCYICKQPETTRNQHGVRPLSVDHCHKSGQVRRLLCSKCNSALGFINDSVDTLLAMVEYLREFQAMEAAA